MSEFKKTLESAMRLLQDKDKTIIRLETQVKELREALEFSRHVARTVLSKLKGERKVGDRTTENKTGGQ